MNAKVNERKHISTTHNERYYHIDLKDETGAVIDRATVFFRQDHKRDALVTADAGWAASIALCDGRDQFNRSVGRSVARRKFFNKNYQRKEVASKPTYEMAVDLAMQAADKRLTYLWPTLARE